MNYLSKNKRWFIFLLPLLLFLAIAFMLYRGLDLQPKELPSALIGKPFPEFSLPDTLNPQQKITQQDLKGPALVNVWATWCPACKIEHPFLNQLAEQGVKIYGVNYKDETALAQTWIKKLDNPYQWIADDATGSLGVDLGVYGAPETFLIDDQGVIQARFAGVLNEKSWTANLAQAYQKLKRSSESQQ